MKYYAMLLTTCVCNNVYLYPLSQLAKVAIAIAWVASVGLGVGGCLLGQLWPNYNFWVRRGSN